MDMRIIKSELRLCICCMEVHDVKTVLVDEETIFNGVIVPFEACYTYCDLADEFYVNEEQLTNNDIKMKGAYRRLTVKNDKQSH